MEELSFLENLIGVDISDSVLWIVLGVIVLIVIVLIAVGFFKELKKK
jgi:ABC-type lipoprotein release transport system permease subunit